MEITAISDREWVKTGMSDLCRQAGFADCSNLVQRDLEFICDSIESKTGILISLSTIKRLFNGQFSRQPQPATLNAIAEYLGYQNWQDFKKQKSREQHISMTAVTNFIPKQSPRRGFSSYARYFVAAGLLIIVTLGLLAFLKFKKPHANHFEKAQFSMNKTTRNDLPNTVVFNYNLDEVMADSFFIQQSWDRDRRVRIDKNSHTLTDIYYEPGYHVAKLIANDQVIKTIDVSIPTDHWFFYSRERKHAPIPQYISCNGFKNGMLAMDSGEVVNSHVDIQKDQLYLQVYFPSEIEYPGDNYTLHCRVRIRELKNNFCPFLMCEVFCQRNFMFFKSTTKGCTSEAKAQFGETLLDGKTTDLSSLGTDVKQWQDVVITVRDKKATIRINDTEAVATAYQESSGKITGLGFLSNGLPEVDFVKLATLDGKDIYTNNFDNVKPYK